MKNEKEEIQFPFFDFLVKKFSVGIRTRQSVHRVSIGYSPGIAVYHYKLACPASGYSRLVRCSARANLHEPGGAPDTREEKRGEERRI